MQPGQPGQWGAPPPGAGYAGGPPPGAWAPAPAKGSNGCLKACLIVGIILVVLGVIGAIGISILGAKFVEGIGVNPDGSLKSCELISDDELSGILGSGAEALPMGGIIDGTIGQLLDQRILKDAPDCWIVASDSSSSGMTGRLARQDGGDTSGDFARYRQAAQDGGYFAGEVPGYGDEAFCTSATEAVSFGILVRSGGRLAYVSLIDATSMQGGDFEVGPNGEMISPDTCAKAGEIAKAMLN
ncbi:MAG TPA: hypothetical protein VES19_13630 [Candidatus Limnocylindrales bacterium]|nr:hypothetical protein [Candidatus Limnocylindrales bacterium]